jgi:hypothetical protein
VQTAAEYIAARQRASQPKAGRAKQSGNALGQEWNALEAQYCGDSARMTRPFVQPPDKE